MSFVSFLPVYVVIEIFSHSSCFLSVYVIIEIFSLSSSFLLVNVIIEIFFHSSCFLPVYVIIEIFSHGLCFLPVYVIIEIFSDSSFGDYPLAVLKTQDPEVTAKENAKKINLKTLPRHNIKPGMIIEAK